VAGVAGRDAGRRSSRSRSAGSPGHGLVARMPRSLRGGLCVVPGWVAGGRSVAFAAGGGLPGMWRARLEVVVEVSGLHAAAACGAPEDHGPAVQRGGARRAALPPAGPRWGQSGHHRPPSGAGAVVAGVRRRWWCPGSARQAADRLRGDDMACPVPVCC